MNKTLLHHINCLIERCRWFDDGAFIHPVHMLMKQTKRWYAIDFLVDENRKFESRSGSVHLWYKISYSSSWKSNQTCLSTQPHLSQAVFKHWKNETFGMNDSWIFGYIYKYFGFTIFETSNRKKLIESAKLKVIVCDKFVKLFFRF